MGNDSTRLVPRISCSTTLITPPWLNTTMVSSCSAPAATSSTAARTRARNASSSTALGRCPAAMRAHSCGFSSRMCSIGIYTGRSRSYSAQRSSISTASPRATATGSAVWIARRCGLLTTREMGNLASASGSRATCARPSSERSGSAPWPGSLRSGNACRTRSNCIPCSLPLAPVAGRHFGHVDRSSVRESTLGDISALPMTALLVCGVTGHDTAVGRATMALAKELQALDIAVTVSRSAADAAAVVASNPDLGVIIADWELSRKGDGCELVDQVRARNQDIPLFLMTTRGSIESIPVAVVRECDGFVYPLDDTADWIAGRLRDASLRYRRALLPPMFAGLVKFAGQHEYSWHTPGHEGGAGFRKSPVGRAFFEFFGEQTFRSDLSISVAELGSLLDHSGLIGDAEREAARIFNADFTLFGTNGTSTSNRVVHQATVTAGDTVLLDRNAHKSAEQATTITHARAIYMVPTRNAYGIIGPIPPAEMSKTAVADKLVASPLATGAPVLAMVTNSTYDGLLYHVPTVERALGAHVDRLHFDEAWYGYAAFNPLYHERYAMHRGEREPNAPTLFATQSTHKLLSALSQASYIHIRNGRKPIDFDHFNEAFMMS